MDSGEVNGIAPGDQHISQNKARSSLFDGESDALEHSRDRSEGGSASGLDSMVPSRNHCYIGIFFAHWRTRPSYTESPFLLPLTPGTLQIPILLVTVSLQIQTSRGRNPKLPPCHNGNFTSEGFAHTSVLCRQICSSQAECRHLSIPSSQN